MILSKIPEVDTKIQLIKQLLCTYRYNELQSYYEKLNSYYTILAGTIIQKAIDNNFTVSFETIGCIDNNDEIIHVNYYNVDDNKLTYIDSQDDIITIFINTKYLLNDGNEQLIKDSIVNNLFYCDYYYSNHIQKNCSTTYIDNLYNDINMSSIDFSIIKQFLLLLSPSEHKLRCNNVHVNIDALTNNEIDIICYKQHDIKRIAALIDYTVGDNYYNNYIFFISHFKDMTKDKLIYLLYFGYYLTKLNIFNCEIDKKYIKKVSAYTYTFNNVLIL